MYGLGHIKSWRFLLFCRSSDFFFHYFLQGGMGMWSKQFSKRLCCLKVDMVPCLTCWQIVIWLGSPSTEKGRWKENIWQFIKVFYGFVRIITMKCYIIFFRQLESRFTLSCLLICSNYTVWKLRKFTLTPFWQKFRESNIFTKESTKQLIWRKIFCESKL